MPFSRYRLFQAFWCGQDALPCDSGPDGAQAARAEGGFARYSAFVPTVPGVPVAGACHCGNQPIPSP